MYCPRVQMFARGGEDHDVSSQASNSSRHESEDKGVRFSLVTLLSLMLT